MPKKKDPSDVNQLAYSIVRDLTGDDPPSPESGQKQAETGKESGVERDRERIPAEAKRTRKDLN